MRTWLLLWVAGCATTTAGSTPERKQAAEGAVRALQAGQFDEAQKAADAVLQSDADNSRARLVAAITRYKAAMHQVFGDLRTAAMGAFTGGPNDRFMRYSIDQALGELARVDADLERVAKDPAVDLELCLACWKVDWNHSGRLDSNDDKLFQIEVDADGKELPEDDPRRKPTFHFDVGDVHWARAFVSFQRAALELIAAYDWHELVLAIESKNDTKKIVLHVGDPARVQRARELILTGLDEADRARVAYLAETDDDREWVPNPRQKNHPMPLPMDETVYQTWEGVVGDLRRMLTSEEGLSVEQVAQAGKNMWERPPRGYIDLGRLLREPHDIVLDFDHIEHFNRDPEAILRDLFGPAYVTTMKPTPLVGRLSRMAEEVERGTESAERKLRYLLWLN